MKILLIEDSLFDAKLMEDMLSETGEDFTLAREATLAGAITRLVNDVPDLVLTDLHLPDSRGEETLSRLRPHLKDAAAVIVTADDDLATALRTLHNGAFDYAVKGNIDSKLMKRILHRAKASREKRHEDNVISAV